MVDTFRPLDLCDAALSVEDTGVRLDLEPPGHLSRVVPTGSAVGTTLLRAGASRYVS